MEEVLRDISEGVEDVIVKLHSDINQFHFPFEYIKESFAGVGKEDDETFDEQYAGCSCFTSEDDTPGMCRPTGCECIDRFGPVYDDRGRLLDTDPCTRMMRPIIECNRACTCAVNPNYCSNRIIQRGLVHRLQVFPAGKKGAGVRTLERIERNSFVCEYAGEIISDSEARKRTKSCRLGDDNYILTLREHIGGSIPGRGDVRCTYIDATHYGNVGRMINHSCDPNLYMVPARVNNSIPRASLFALRVIEPDEELTYEYSGDLGGSDVPTPDESSETERSFATGESKTCFCGAVNCRRYLPSDSSAMCL